MNPSSIMFASLAQALVEMDSKYSVETLAFNRIVVATVLLECGKETTVDVDKIRKFGETSANGSPIGVYIDDDQNYTVGQLYQF